MSNTVDRDRDQHHRRYGRLMEAAQRLPPVTTAVVHPCDRVSLESIIEAARLRLIEPILVAPPARLHHEVEIAGLDISSFATEASEHRPRKRSNWCVRAERRR
jgi:phosphate acetyltransferase